MQTTTTTKNFRALLQDITCDRYFDRSEAVQSIYDARNAGTVTNDEAKKLIKALDNHEEECA